MSAKSQEPKLQHIEETTGHSEYSLPRLSASPDYPARPTDPCGAKKSEQPLGSNDFDILKEMVEQYKAHRLDFSALPRRPRFKGPRVNSGITCNTEIRNRALEKAHADPDGTGGSLSSLIELLLWVFLECPQDVVERFPR